MVEGTAVRDHVLKMISYIDELETLGANIDGETKVDAILSSLSENYNQFILNYNMNKMSSTLSELLNMLQAAEDLIKKEKGFLMLFAKLVSSSGTKPFHPKGRRFNNKRKWSQKSQVGPPARETKE
ncbi:uncharacterized protein LOC108511839 [Phoenix dactylifera]|uniref:Uncharacterized protein LOC108511839 n=1 Tax=Phoenix dactylifera TaxID=42345 RepID=A0A8B7MXR7_PHODC|nr:uncharacterized protein LOC108511839 [Phoenix dactylifera]